MESLTSQSGKVHDSQEDWFCMQKDLISIAGIKLKITLLWLQNNVKSNIGKNKKSLCKERHQEYLQEYKNIRHKMRWNSQYLPSKQTNKQIKDWDGDREIQHIMKKKINWEQSRTDTDLRFSRQK